MPLSDAEVERRLNPQRFSYTVLPARMKSERSLGADKHSTGHGHTAGGRDVPAAQSTATILPLRLFNRGIGWTCVVIVIVALIFRASIDWHAPSPKHWSRRPYPRFAHYILPPFLRATSRGLYRSIITQKDYALSNNGGEIYCKLTSGCRSGFFFEDQGSAVYSIIENLDVGKCWKAQGIPATLGIALSQPIYPKFVAVDHPRAARHGLLDVPRNVTLWGSIEGKNNNLAYQRLVDSQIVRAEDTSSHKGTGTFLRLASFEFDIDAPEDTQIFPVFDHIQKGALDFAVVAVEVGRSWGGGEVCLYRVRVYGDPILDDDGPLELA